MSLIRPRTPIALVLAVLVSLSITTDVYAAIGCAFDSGTLTIDGGVGDPTLARAGTDITLDGEVCPGATVSTTDTISISLEAAGTVTLDLSAGPFAPGATDELDGSSEIEITVSTSSGFGDLALAGSALADSLVVDDVVDMANLNAEEAIPDNDLTWSDNNNVRAIDLGEGSDVARTHGVGEADLIGGDGDDTFTSTDDFLFHLDAGPGVDHVSYADNSEPVVYFGDSSVAGIDSGGGQTVLEGVEGVIGTEHDDRFSVGGGVSVSGGAEDDAFSTYEGVNVVRGGAGDFDYLHLVGDLPLIIDLAGLARGDGRRTTFNGFDVVVGSDSDDLIRASRGNTLVVGSDGFDTYSVVDSPHGVEIDLAGETVSNGDRLDTVEGAIGSRFRDQIVGSALDNMLSGRGGDDVLRGLAAHDVLLGGRGDDRLEGGADVDRCRGGGGNDVLVAC